MERYREFAQSVMKRAGIPLDESLASIALVIRAVVGQLPAFEAAVLKMSLVPELQQLVVESRLTASMAELHNGREIVASVGAALEISDVQAKARVLSVLDELRAGVSVWDDVAILEVIDHVRADVDSVPVQAAVA